jgi:transcriptional regulator with XRE-family HTH domain
MQPNVPAPAPPGTIPALGAMVRAKRGHRSLRAVADRIGVSVSTISRVEQGKEPDLTTFFRLCDWLDVSPGEFAPSAPGATETSSLSTAEIVVAYLRADRTLPVETADALVTLIRLAYAAVTTTAQAAAAAAAVEHALHCDTEGNSTR